MLLIKRLPWMLMVLLLLVVAIAISSIESTEEIKLVENHPKLGTESEPVEDGEGYDYDGSEGDGENEGDLSILKEPLHGNLQQYPPIAQPGYQFSQVSYVQPPPQQSNYVPQPQPPPPPPQQPSYVPPPQESSYVLPPQQSSYVPSPPQTDYVSPPNYGPIVQPQVIQTYYPEPVNQGYLKPVPVPIPALNYSIPLEIEAPIVVEPLYNPQPLPPPPQPTTYSNYTLAPSVVVEPQPNYQQQPPTPAHVYLPPVTATYQQPPPPPPTTHSNNNYQQPSIQYQLPQQQSYQAKPAIPLPKAPTYAATQPKPVNYAPVYPPTVQYTPVVLLKTNNYTQPNYQQSKLLLPIGPHVHNYKPNYAGVQQYSTLDVAPIVSHLNYRANNPWLTYYKQLQFRNCPKGSLLGVYGISPQDITGAIAHAQSQLGQFRGSGIQYMNSTAQPSFTARHQIFSFLSQQNARMDEEGLLVELVSLYLADRVCMTKWDRQRYLPKLTKLITTNQFPGTHSCNNYYNQQQWQQNAMKSCLSSRYRTYDGFCNNPYQPYWGKSNVCHIRLLSPDYADGISLPRDGSSALIPNGRLPNPRAVSTYIHNDIPLEGPYNLMKMQWGQYINHDITNTALSSYDGLVDCCKQPQVRGCWPIYVPSNDRFYGSLNVTCLNFIRSGVCPTCQLGPRQQLNKNTAFLDLSHVYGNTNEQAIQLRVFRGGQLRTSLSRVSKEVLLPIANSQEQCSGVCYQAGDSRVNQHPALTALHTLSLRNHNRHAYQLALRHPNWSDEQLFQEARRLNIAEYQMITYNEYFPIVFGPILSAYYQLTPARHGYTHYDPKTDPTTWNEYSTATCRFGHSQIHATFGLYNDLVTKHPDIPGKTSFRLKDWYMRPSLLDDGYLFRIINGLLKQPSQSVDPWITNDVRNHLYQHHTASSGGDLAATNIWRGRDHGIPGYTHYVEYCFNIKIKNWNDLAMFIPPVSLNQLRKIYRHPESIDLFSGGMAERHFPGADIGPTFACVNGIQYFHLKFGDRYYFEHGGQAGSFNPVQLDEIRRSTLSRFLCRTSNIQHVPQFAFLHQSIFNPLVSCSSLGDIDYNKF